MARPDEGSRNRHFAAVGRFEVRDFSVRMSDDGTDYTPYLKRAFERLLASKAIVPGKQYYCIITPVGDDFPADSLNGEVSK